jgi:hypothetical protein
VGADWRDSSLLSCCGWPSLPQPGQRPGCTEISPPICCLFTRQTPRSCAEHSHSYWLWGGAGFATLQAVPVQRACICTAHGADRSARRCTLPTSGHESCAAGLLRLQDSASLPNRLAVGVSDGHADAHGSADVGCGRSAMLGPWAVRRQRRVRVPVFVGLVRRSVRQALHPLSHGACPPARPPWFTASSAFPDTRALRCAAWRASATARRSCARRSLRSFPAWRPCTARRQAAAGLRSPLVASPHPSCHQPAAPGRHRAPCGNAPRRSAAAISHTLLARRRKRLPCVAMVPPSAGWDADRSATVGAVMPSRIVRHGRAWVEPSAHQGRVCA